MTINFLMWVVALALCSFPIACVVIPKVVKRGMEVKLIMVCGLCLFIVTAGGNAIYHKAGCGTSAGCNLYKDVK